MDTDPKKEMFALGVSPEDMQKAFAAATERELRRHKRLGFSISGGIVDGKPVTIAPEDIPVSWDGPVISPWYEQRARELYGATFAEKSGCENLEFIARESED